MRKHLWRSILVVATLVAGIGLATGGAPAPATALSGSDFNPEQIISDGEFFDHNSMNEAQIQSFLEAKVPSCAPSGQPCLKDYSTSSTSRASAGANHCSAYEGAASERASRIIFKVAQACRINPKVLLVTLQKEQTLITERTPTANDYRIAMGFGCPDTAPCDAQYFGFYNQVYKAAWQFRQYTKSPNSWRYKVGNVAVQYNPNASCGSTVLNIRNQATANLYNYTPYQPNAAALANLYGKGNDCSAYGNRNFWVFYNEWFGETNTANNPVSSLDVMTSVPGGIRVAGWVFDPDTADSTQVHVYVNGVGYAVPARNDRPDVGATWPKVGSAHGFDQVVPVAGEGPQNVCVHAINLGVGRNTLIRCETLPGMTGSPNGVIDVISGFGGIVTVAGWSYDPDTAASTPVHVYIGGTGYDLQANMDRPDFDANYPGYGPKHGYSYSLPAPPGDHNVCIYGINVAGNGGNKLLGCQAVTIRSGSPTGVVDSVKVSPGSVTVSGWVFDPDTRDSTPVHVYVGNNGVAATANSPRPDVAAAYPGYGEAHGYSVTMPLPEGPQNLCVYGIDVAAPGSNKALLCQTVAAPSGSPVGVVDSVTAADGVVTASGWAYDPDTSAPIPVHIYYNAEGVAFTADKPRADVGAVYPAYGPNHGYSESRRLAPGTYNVCVYGINTGAGSNKQLGCKSVTV